MVYLMPIVLGHEAAGVIAAWVPGLIPDGWASRVVLSWNPHCGQCVYCGRGQPILCDRYVSQAPAAVAFDGTTRLSLGGTPVRTMMNIAAFASTRSSPTVALLRSRPKWRWIGPAFWGVEY